MAKLSQKILDTLEKWFNAGYGLFPRVAKNPASQPILVGHRGLCGHPEIKENTIEAFDVAIGLGGGIELDLHLSRDLVPVVSHDSDLNRIHGVPRLIKDLDLQEIKELAPAVPSLEEVFSRYGKQCPHYFLEAKIYQPEQRSQELISAIKELVGRYQLLERVTLISLDSRPLDTARVVYPELAKVFVFCVNPSEAVSYALENQDTGLAGWYFSFPRKVRKFLAERNLHEGVGQVDYKNSLTACSNRGFRYVFSNRIDRVVSSN